MRDEFKEICGEELPECLRQFLVGSFRTHFFKAERFSSLVDGHIAVSMDSRCNRNFISQIPSEDKTIVAFGYHFKGEGYVMYAEGDAETAGRGYRQIQTGLVLEDIDNPATFVAERRASGDPFPWRALTPSEGILAALESGRLYRQEFFAGRVEG